MHKSIIVKNVPAPGHYAEGGLGVYGQVDIPKYNIDGTPQWEVRFETFRINTIKHQGLANKLELNHKSTIDFEAYRNP